MDTEALASHYETLTGLELLSLKREGGLREEAVPVLLEELNRRNLSENSVESKEASLSVLQHEAKEKGFRGSGPALLFFGRAYLDAADERANIQVRTKWFALGGVPLIPLASYRFQGPNRSGSWLGKDGEQRVLNRVPLHWKQVASTWVRTVAVLLGLLFAGAAFLWFESRKTQ